MQDFVHQPPEHKTSPRFSLWIPHLFFSHFVPKTWTDFGFAGKLVGVLFSPPTNHTETRHGTATRLGASQAFRWPSVLRVHWQRGATMASACGNPRWCHLWAWGEWGAMLLSYPVKEHSWELNPPTLLDIVDAWFFKVSVLQTDTLND